MPQAGTLCDTVKGMFVAALGPPAHTTAEKWHWSLTTRRDKNTVHVLLDCGDPVAVWVFDPGDRAEGVIHAKIMNGWDADAILASLRARAARDEGSG
jgi:hypothetical protein